MRDRFYKMPDEQREQARNALLAGLIERVSEMCETRLQSVVRFAEIETNNSGCVTPAEEYLSQLVDDHYERGLTPDDAAERLETFREDFTDVLKTSTRFIARYPETLKPAPAE
jgi:hypothetical protein